MKGFVFMEKLPNKNNTYSSAGSLFKTKTEFSSERNVNQEESVENAVAEEVCGMGEFNINVDELLHALDSKRNLEKNPDVSYSEDICFVSEQNGMN